MGAAKPGVIPPGAAPTRGESGDRVNPWYMRYPGTYPAPISSSFKLLGADDVADGAAAGAGPGSTGAGGGASGATAGAGLGSAGAGSGASGTAVGAGLGCAAGASAPACAPSDAVGAGAAPGDAAASAEGPVSGRASNFRTRSAQITPRPRRGW